MPVTLVQVPQQPNGLDCDIFVLSFIETILSSDETLESLFSGNSVSNYWGTADAICSRRDEFRARLAQSVTDGLLLPLSFMYTSWIPILMTTRHVATDFRDTFARFVPRTGTG